MSRILLPGKTPIKRWSGNASALTGPLRDPSFANVVLLTHLDVNGSTTFTDSSSRGNNFASANGSALNQSNVEKKFGAASMWGNGSQPGTAIASSDWNFGTADFTIEWWGLHGAVGSVFTTHQKSAGVIGIAVRTLGTDIRIYTNFNVDQRFFTGGTSNGPGNWNFYTLNRVSAAWVATMNGVVLTGASAAGDGFPATKNITNTLARLAAYWNDGDAFGTLNGYFDEIRITKGVARYIGAHAVPDAPFPNS